MAKLHVNWRAFWERCETHPDEPVPIKDLGGGYLMLDLPPMDDPLDNPSITHGLYNLRGWDEC